MTSEFSHRASLVLNVILAVSVTLLVLRKLQPASEPLAADLASEEPTLADSVENPDGPLVATEPAELPIYALITSPSDRRRAIIDQLRVMGVPNEVLGRVARVDFEVQWDSRFKECWGDMNKMAAVQLEMNMNKDAEMRAALGETDFKQWDQGYMLWEAMSTKVETTAAEAEALYALKKKLQQRMLELDQARVQGAMDDAEIDRALDQAYSEFNQNMRALLGEERYAYSQQLDDDFIAGNLRHQLANANPTEDQFQELFELERKFSKAQSALDISSPNFSVEFKALNEARDEEYQRVLGSDAFYNLRKEQDALYVQMKKFESLWELDDSKIDYAYRTMKQYQKSVEDYQLQVLALQGGGQGVDWNDVNTKLRQIAEQTQHALQDHLGQHSFDKLQRNRVLRWATVASLPTTVGAGPPP